MDFVDPAARGRPADRAPNSPVDCTGSLLAATVPSMPFAVDGDRKTLPLYILEAVYARVLRPAQDIGDYAFGAYAIDPRVFARLEDRLRTLAARGAFVTHVCSLPEYVARVVAANLEGDAVALLADNLVRNVAMPGATHEDLAWFDKIRFDTLTSGTGDLAPYGDLANLIGDRTHHGMRKLDGSNRASAVVKLLDARVRAVDELPRAPAVAPAGGQGNAGAGHFLPKTDDADEVLDGIGRWLGVTAMPAQHVSRRLFIRQCRPRRGALRFRGRAH